MAFSQGWGPGKEEQGQATGSRETFLEVMWTEIPVKSFPL